MAEVMKAPNKTVAVVPDTREIDQKALSAVDSARELSIKDQKQFAHAADFLQGLKTIEKAIDETFDPVIKAAFDAHKAALAAGRRESRAIKLYLDSLGSRRRGRSCCSRRRSWATAPSKC